MSNYYQPPQPAPAGAAQNLPFFPTSYSPSLGAGGGAGAGGAPGSSAYGAYRAPSAAGAASSWSSSSYSALPGISGRMGERGGVAGPAGGLRTGWLAAFSTEGYDGEPTLLEELDVNFAHVQAKTLAVLNPFRRVDQHLMDDSDLAGPFLFCALFGTFLFFSGQVDFGYIYGLAAFGIPLLHSILSLMSPGTDHSAGGGGASAPSAPASVPLGPQPGALPPAGGSTLTFPRSASVLGYCLLPLVATSLCGIVMPMDTPVGIVLTAAAIMWCTYSATGIFCAVGRMRAMRPLVAYPLALFYAGWGIMSVFSSQGSGALAKARAG